MVVVAEVCTAQVFGMHSATIGGGAATTFVEASHVLRDVADRRK
jgi:hypothetical protein